MDMIRWQYITDSSDITLVKASSISVHDILGTVDDARCDDVRVLLYFLAWNLLFKPSRCSHMH